MINILKINIYKTLFKLSDNKFVYLYNFINKYYWKYPFNLILKNNNKIIISSLDNDNLVLQLSKKIRISRYKYGIKFFLLKLAKQYFIDKIDFNDGDIVVDCGANIGEVGLYLKNINKTIKVYAIEPEEAEANACDVNIYDDKKNTTRKALWNSNGKLKFYSKNSTGDSSLFEQNEYDNIIEIDTITLDDFCNDKKINFIKLLKLEAEGAEPEILYGAKNMLSKIEYIAVDCGPERGISMEPTFIPVYNFLISNNYKLIDIKFDRIVALFKRNF